MYSWSTNLGTDYIFAIIEFSSAAVDPKLFISDTNPSTAPTLETFWIRRGCNLEKVSDPDPIFHFLKDFDPSMLQNNPKQCCGSETTVLISEPEPKFRIQIRWCKKFRI